jgi:hypothetical protein
MTYSVPDICDEFPAEISVLEPLFGDMLAAKAEENGIVIAPGDLGVDF